MKEIIKQVEENILLKERKKETKKQNEKNEKTTINKNES